MTGPTVDVVTKVIESMEEEAFDQATMDELSDLEDVVNFTLGRIRGKVLAKSTETHRQTLTTEEEE